MASNTSCKCRELGVVTSTASTPAERQRSSVESNARGILYCRADSWALCRSRRESALTRQFFASEKPGMSRRTACNPKPTIPNRIIFVRICFALRPSNHSGRLPPCLELLGNGWLGSPLKQKQRVGSLRRRFFGKYRGRVLLDYFVAIAPTNDWKILNPSVQPSSGSDERSGWGIMPRTFRPALQIPAILSREPFGLASTVTRP